MKSIVKVVLERTGLLQAGLCLCLAGCTTMSDSKNSINKSAFGKSPEGQPVDLYTLKNTHGTEVQIATYGGIVTSIIVPDKHGKMADVVLGHDNLDGYIKSSPYFGCLVGRYGNRIAKGQFSLDGHTYKLAINNAPNSLHGGLKGFDKVVWKAVDANVGPDGPRLELNYLSKDGEEGFPGNLNVRATYTLTADNGLRLEYVATTDKETVVNLTQHSYFNLAGKGDILKQEVRIDADKFTPVDATLIPTGELKPVKGTPFDFHKATAIGAHINKKNDEQLKFGGGYDHNWVLNKPKGKLAVVATACDPGSGRFLEVLSTEPGVQFYTGNHLNGSITGKGGWVYTARSGFCFEPQHFPDSPNQPKFPSVVLKPGDTYKNTIIYRFSVK